MTGPVLDPEFAHLAEFDIGIGSGVDLAPIRSGISSSAPPPPAVDGVLAEHVHIGPEPDVAVETFRPTRGGPHPALVWFHGGGYVIGAASMDGLRLQQWAERFDCFVASVDYRLAPDHAFPAAHDDAMAALDWVLRSANDLDVDPERVIVGGASAGAGLAAGVALAARDRGTGPSRPAPLLPDAGRPPADPVEPMARGRVVTDGQRVRLAGLSGRRLRRRRVRVRAPARATSYDGLPPTIVLVGGADGFFDEDVAYAAELTRAGVPTEVRVYAGVPHGFDLVAPESSVAAVASSDAERWLARVLEAPELG